MRIVEENWKVLTSLFPAGWQQMAWQSGAVERLRGFPSPDVLLRMLMLHVARGCSLRETVVRAKPANWTDISDVALLKRLRNSAEWLRFLCIELLRENVAYRLEEGISRKIRIVDGTIVREPGKTGSQDLHLGAIFPPRATHSRRGGPCSPSREFSFALHQIQPASEPHLSLQQTLYSWNRIAQALAERSRSRLLQLAKWHAS